MGGGEKEEGQCPSCHATKKMGGGCRGECNGGTTHEPETMVVWNGCKINVKKKRDQDTAISQRVLSVPVEMVGWIVKERERGAGSKKGGDWHVWSFFRLRPPARAHARRPYRHRRHDDDSTHNALKFLGMCIRSVFFVDTSSSANPWTVLLNLNMKCEISGGSCLPSGDSHTIPSVMI